MVKVASFEVKQKRNGGEYLEVEGTENGELRTYVCNFEPAMSIIKACNRGDEFEFMSKPTGDGKYFLSAPKGTPMPANQPPVQAQGQSSPAPEASPTSAAAPTAQSAGVSAAVSKNATFACSYAKDVVVGYMKGRNVNSEELDALFLHCFALFKYAMDTGMTEHLEHMNERFMTEAILEKFEGSRIITKEEGEAIK